MKIQMRLYASEQRFFSKKSVDESMEKNIGEFNKKKSSEKYLPPPPQEKSKEEFLTNSLETSLEEI